LRLLQGLNTRAEHELLVRILAGSARAAGVAAERLEFVRAVDKPAHLRRMAVGSDLFLDTDAYSAHSTGLEALWAGVPLLTFPGVSFASRAPASFLAGLGMPELTARGIVEYEAMANALVRRGRVLGEWRQRLFARRLLPSGLFSEASTLGSMMTALRLMWDVRVALGSRHVSMHIIVV